MSNTVRQSAAPMPFDTTRRMDNVSRKTTGQAGVVIPVAVAPLHRGDSATGRLLIDLELAEMPKPLENAVIARGQAWFVPRPSLPHFEGTNEYVHAWNGKSVTALGASDRSPKALFDTVSSGSIAAAQASEFFTALGISLQANTAINTDYIDAYVHVQNFRLAAHSSKLTPYEYYQEDNVAALELKPAFWPRNRMHNIVPDYEQALVKGSLDLDISAGAIPVTGLGIQNEGATTSITGIAETEGDGNATYTGWRTTDAAPGAGETRLAIEEGESGEPNIYAQMAGQTIATTLADIDKARTTQAFAKARAAYEGNNFSGYNVDDVIVAELMQGFRPPEDLFQRPWLLDNKTVVFGQNERHATDAANLDDSIVVGRAGMALSLNIPRAEYGGVMIATIEVMPERLFERQSDEYLYVTGVSDLPDAERDLQRAEPVDTVTNRRIDTAHTSPSATYGYEPMNRKWDREFTSFGGEFRQLTPGTPSTIARNAIWQADYVDPQYTSDHFLCEHPFPQDVFSVPANDAVYISVIQQMTIVGHTQFGDNLVEDNGEFVATVAEQA
jgi:hypothetical protein